MKIRFVRTIEINKSSAYVYAIISDLNQWNIWSPWFHSEPTAKTTVNGKNNEIGHTMEWVGDVIGSGKMTLQEIQNDKVANYKLEFFKPFKSLAAANFTVESLGQDKCKVGWTMDSNMPFFMIFFKKMITAFMSYDFDRGLKMLKEYAETGTVVSKSIFQGKKNLDGFQIVGKKTTCAIVDLSKSMQTDFQQMTGLMQKGEFNPPIHAVSLYHKFDIPNGICEYTAGFSYKNDQQVKAPANYNTQQFENHTGLAVDHYGPYRHLGNPWSMINSCQRAKKIKMRKDVPMYEIYVTMPDGRAEKDIYTQIYMPIK